MAETTGGSGQGSGHSEESGTNGIQQSLLDKLRRGLRTSPDQNEAVKARRRFVGVLTGGFLFTNFLMFLRFFFPRTIFEPRTVFRSGAPTDFGIGVDTKFQKSHQSWRIPWANFSFPVIPNNPAKGR